MYSNESSLITSMIGQITVDLNHTTRCKCNVCVLGMCKINFLCRFGLGSFFLNSDSVQNEFCSVRLKKIRFSSDIVVICNS